LKKEQFEESAARNHLEWLRAFLSFAFSFYVRFAPEIF
jgi:hypothetical protein